MQVRPLAGLLLVPYMTGNLVAALLLTTSGLAQETTPPTPEELKLPSVQANTAGTSTSVRSTNGSGPDGSRPAAATAGGNGAEPMDKAVLGTGDASVSGNGTDFRRQNGSGGNGLSAGPVRLPVGRDVSVGAMSQQSAMQGQGCGWGHFPNHWPATHGPGAKVRGLHRASPIVSRGRQAIQQMSVRRVDSCRGGASNSVFLCR